MAKKWKQIKSEIERLYMREGKSLEEVRALMKENHGFEASIRTYKNAFEKWGYRKYRKGPHRPAGGTHPRNPQCDQAGVEATAAAAELLANFDPAAVKAKLENDERELQRLAKLTQEQNLALCILRDPNHAEPRLNIEKVNESIQAIAKIEDTILGMRKSIDMMLASVKLQSSAPSGFASSWEQEPMFLEDALGRLITIPLGQIRSWEMFEDILISRFRCLPGSKKVLRGEYAIEDSSTGTSITKEQPWSTFSKPGLKVDMSMIFKDSGKSDVVCPKCDTFSREKKGILVQCKNPGCNMLFRTEEYEDQVTQTMSPRSKKRRLRAGATPAHVQSNEEEDQPGMFKRVIIRVLRANLPRHQSSKSMQKATVLDLELPWGYNFDTTSNFHLPSSPANGHPPLLSNKESKLLDWFVDDVSTDQLISSLSTDLPPAIWLINSNPSDLLSEPARPLPSASDEADLARRVGYMPIPLDVRSTLQSTSASLSSGFSAPLDSTKQNSNIHALETEPSTTMTGSSHDGFPDDDGGSDVEIIIPSESHDNGQHAPKKTRYLAVSTIDNFRDAGYADLVFGSPLDTLVRSPPLKNMATDIRWGSDMAFWGSTYSGTEQESKNWSMRTWDDILRSESQ